MARSKKKAVAPVEAMVSPAIEEEQDLRSPLAIATGSDHLNTQRALVADATNVLGLKPDTDAYDFRTSAAFGLLSDFQPRDGVEGMLSAQSVAAHSAGMAALRQAALPGLTPENASRLRRDAANLFRTVADMIQTIETRRGGGTRQRIVVEHVSQAVFAVQGGGGGK